MSDAMLPIEMSCDDVREIAGAFVLGALEPAEAAAVRAHLATCQEAHEELAVLAGVLPAMQATVPQVAPPAALKTRLMAAAAADLEARRAEVAATPPAAAHSAPAAAPSAPAAAPSAPAAAPSAPHSSPDTSAIAFPAARDAAVVDTGPRPIRRTAPLTWAMRIAAILVIGVLGSWNLLLQGQLDASRTYETNVAAVLDLAREAGSSTAVLRPGREAGPAGLAAVGADGTMAVAMRDLAPTAGSEVYEVWMIGGDGVPVALGGFTVGATGIGYFEGAGVPATPGIVLALTREPAPGATEPSSDPVSVGTVS